MWHRFHGAWFHTLPYKQSLNSSSFNFPEWNLIFAVYQIRSDQISLSVVSDSLRHHELQHARPPCPSPTPGVHSDSCPSSQWCSPLISMVRFLMLKKAISVRSSLCLYISSSSYQSGLGVWGFQDTRSCVFSSFSGFQFHSISRMLGYKGVVSVSWTDVPTVLFNVQEELGYLTAWESGEGLDKPGGRKKQSKYFAISAVFTSH